MDKKIFISISVLVIALCAGLFLYFVERDNECTHVVYPEAIYDDAMHTILPTTNSYINHVASYINEELAFSVTDAFHTTAIAVDIIAYNPNAIIHYTLDGSRPTTDSAIFNTSLDIGGTISANPAVVVRAIAIYNGQAIAEIAQTYFVAPNISNRFDTLVFSISTNPEYLFDHYTGIFVPGILREEFIRNNPGRHVNPPDPANFNLRGREAERPIVMEVFDPANSAQRVFIQNAGIRVHGGWSRAHEQKSMRLIARHEHSPGAGQFHFDFFPWEFAHDGSPITRYDTLILRNGGNDRYHGIMRHEVGSVLARNAGFTAVSPVRAAAVFLNGEYYGFAWLQVRFNPQYIENLFNTPTRSIDVVGMGERWFDTDDQQIISDLHFKNSFSYKDLTDDNIFAQLEAILDIENMLFYYAFQIYMGNDDWPHNNLRRWRYTGPVLGLTPEADGRWRYIMFDLDWTLGLYGRDYTEPTFSRVLGPHNPRSPLLRNILTRDDMLIKFTEIMNYIAFEVATPQNVEDTITYLLSTSLNEVAHALLAGKYPGWFNMQTMENNHRDMLHFANNRHRQIFADLERYFWHMRY